jgi:Rhodanese-related sulfurtransferase
VYCKSGARSNKAAKQLQEMGYDVRELQGGLLNWQSEGYPVVKDTKNRLKNILWQPTMRPYLETN